MTDSLRPDAVYDPTGHPVAVRGMWMKEAALALPNLVKLVYRLMKDARIPRKSKMILGAILGYMVVPLDIVPDFLPVVGQADDALLLAYGIRHIIDVAGRHERALVERRGLEVGMDGAGRIAGRLRERANPKSINPTNSAPTASSADSRP